MDRNLFLLEYDCFCNMEVIIGKVVLLGNFDYMVVMVWNVFFLGGFSVNFLGVSFWILMVFDFDYGKKFLVMFIVNW